jgi:hypothetical protein
MSQRQLKTLVQAGHYKPDPELIAEAMLQRRGLRALLGGDQVSEADRIRASQPRRHQAA